MRKVVAAMTKDRTIVDGLGAIQAAKAFCHDFLHANTFNGLVIKPSGEGGDVSSGDQDADAAESTLEKGWEKEVIAWMDMPVSFPEFVMGVTQLAHQSKGLLGEGDLAARLQVLLEKIEVAVGMSAPKETQEDHDGEVVQQPNEGFEEEEEF